MTNAIEIGRIYYSGNTMNPQRSKPIAIVDWDDLPARVQLLQAPHTARVFERRSGAQWVRFAQFGSVRRFGHLPLGVYTATRHESIDAMISAYGGVCRG